METGARLDLFEPDDLTALVCHDVPEVRRLVVEQLSELGYKGFLVGEALMTAEDPGVMLRRFTQAREGAVEA